MPTDGRRWSDADREFVAVVLASRSPYERHGQKCPVWTSRPVGRSAASPPPADELTVCDCWVMRVAQRAAAAVLDALTAAGWRPPPPKAAIVVKPTLDKPYHDEPTLTPWTRFMERPARRAYNLGVEIARAHATTLTGEDPR